MLWLISFDLGCIVKWKFIFLPDVFALSRTIEQTTGCLLFSVKFWTVVGSTVLGMTKINTARISQTFLSIATHWTVTLLVARFFCRLMIMGKFYVTFIANIYVSSLSRRFWKASKVHLHETDGSLRRIFLKGGLEKRLGIGVHGYSAYWTETVAHADFVGFIFSWVNTQATDTLINHSAPLFGNRLDLSL